MGIQAKLSWLSPNTLPFFSATPTILKGRPSSRTSLPRGSMRPEEGLHEVGADHRHQARLVDVVLDEVAARDEVAHAADAGDVLGDPSDLARCSG